MYLAYLQLQKLQTLLLLCKNLWILEIETKEHLWLLLLIGLEIKVFISSILAIILQVHLLIRKGNVI